MAVRQGDWKLVRYDPVADGKDKGEATPPRLYNLATDLGEKTDVAAKNPAIVEKVSKLMASQHTEERDYPAEKGSHKPKDYVR